MIRYRPRYVSIAIHLFVVASCLFALAFFIGTIARETDVMRWFMVCVVGFLSLIMYIHLVPVLTWPCAVAIDQQKATITFCYLLFRKQTPVDHIEKCIVTEALNRYPYATYLVKMKKGCTITLSDLTIADFPGPFAYNIGVDISERRPRFVPGFRWFTQRRK